MRLFLPLLMAGSLLACSSTPIHEPTPLEPLATAVKVQKLWSVSLPSSSKSLVYDHLQSVLQGGVIYSVSAGGVVQANDIGKAALLWKQNLDVVVSAGLAIEKNLLVLATSEAEVIAMAKDDGKVLWRSPVSSEVLAQPVISGNFVIVRSADGVTQALNVDDGELLWSFSSNVPALSLRGDATPVVSGDLVLLGQANGRLSALSIFDGVLQWEAVVVVPQGRTDLERMVDVDATPLVVDDVVYVAAHQGRVLALSRLTGATLWSRDLGTSIGMSVDNEKLYIVDDEGLVWALDRRNGATLWKLDKLKYRDLSAPVGYADSIVVGDFEGQLHWISKDSGAITARYQVDDAGVRVAPLVRDGILYSRSKSGRLEALRLK
ncbi:MAG TPA: outer membrane protein assembly factor BamB [Candidatus Tenderia electrophaga]|uniref:Outer membrane protein assembly factor BamB n=1 Tax=Candidatus Tenderia electrophaga TaxID=1748243 RepID=A0A832J3E5_9GAMM|nr:outer membrane protein assembly factor BamB [Candidatus Tenderia electrophaga]